MAELQNANPTIINLSELPTRRRQKGGAQSHSVELNVFTPRAPHWEKPSSDVFGGSESESESDGSYAGDPIDEQEIYGTHHRNFPHSAVYNPNVMPRPQSAMLLYVANKCVFGFVILLRTRCIKSQNIFCWRLGNLTPCTAGWDIKQLTSHRSDLNHCRSGAPSHPRSARRRQPTGYPYPTVTSPWGRS